MSKTPLPKGGSVTAPPKPTCDHKTGETVLVEAVFLRCSHTGRAILLIDGSQHHGSRNDGMIVAPMDKVRKGGEVGWQ